MRGIRWPEAGDRAGEAELQARIVQLGMHMISFRKARGVLEEQLAGLGWWELGKRRRVKRQIRLARELAGKASEEQRALMGVLRDVRRGGV